MSLKAFHLVFIVAAILLAVGMAVWSFMNYFSPAGNKVDLIAGIGSICGVIGLIFYERYFLKKFRNVSYL